MDDGAKDLGSRRLNNGITVTITDESRRLAGDRWYVRLVFRIRLADDVARSCLERLDPARAATDDLPVWERLIVRERHFVDEGEVAELRQEMIDGFERSILPYLCSPRGPERLVAERLRSWRPPAAATTDNPYGALDEDDGPADFSFLFSDRPAEGGGQ